MDNNTLEAPQAPPPVTSQGKNKNTMLMIIIGVIIAMFILAGGIFALNTLNAPVKIKEKVQIVQPVFEDLSKSMKKVVDNLKENSSSNASDSNAIEREAEKAKNLAKTAEKDASTLASLMPTLDAKQLSKYKTAMTAYLQKANDLIEISRDEASTTAAYVEPLKQYEKLALTLSGANTSSQDKYIDALNKAIKQEEQIISDLESIKVANRLKKYHEAAIVTFKRELIFLQKTLSALENKKTSDIVAAEQEFTKDLENMKKDANIEKDRLTAEVKDKASELEDVEKKITDEYTSLKKTYNF